MEWNIKEYDGIDKTLFDYFLKCDIWYLIFGKDFYANIALSE
jgi:hypothetical protein